MYVAPPMNVAVPKQNVTDVSFVVQWDAVVDQSDVRYEVIWIVNDNLLRGFTTTVTETSYTVTGLTPNTTYSVTVAVINKKCKGFSPHSTAIIIKTKILFSFNINLSTSVFPSTNPADTSTATIPNFITHLILHTTTTITTTTSFTDLVCTMIATNPPVATSELFEHYVY